MYKRQARSGRPGPVVLDFAKNAQVEKTKYEPTKVDFIRSYVPVPDKMCIRDRGGTDQCFISINLCIAGECYSYTG